MIRKVFGSLIFIFGLIGFSRETDRYLESGSWEISGLLFAAIFVTIGGCLFYFGRLAIIRKRKALDLASSMYQKYEKINTFRISSEVRISATEVKEIIQKAQKDGLFPLSVEII